MICRAVLMTVEILKLDGPAHLIFGTILNTDLER